MFIFDNKFAYSQTKLGYSLLLEVKNMMVI